MLAGSGLLEDRQRIEDFTLIGVIEALARTPGVTIPATDSNRACATIDLFGRYGITGRASVTAANLPDRGCHRDVRFAFGGPGGVHGEPRRVMGNIRVAL